MAGLRKAGAARRTEAGFRAGRKPWVTFSLPWDSRSQGAIQTQPVRDLLLVVQG